MQFMKLNRYLCSCAVLGLLASCSDYLGEKPTSEWNDGYVWTIPELAQGVLYNAYEAISKVPDRYNGNFLDAATDNALTNKYSSSIYKLVSGDFSTYNYPLNNWNSCFNQFQYINSFLENGLTENTLYDRVDTEKDAAIKQRLMGEAHFLRAYWGFQLLQAYGGKSAQGGAALGYPLVMHFVTEEEAANISSYSRNTYRECADQILADLDIAIENLPKAYQNNDDAVFGKTHIGRPTSIAAHALKTRVALYAASPAYQDDDCVSLQGMDRYTIVNKEKYDSNWMQVLKIADELLNDATFSKFNALKPTELADAGNTTPGDFLFRFYFSTKDMETRHFTPYYLGDAANVPTQNLVDAYPMQNGYPIDRAASGYDASNPYQGRDLRFYNTIYYHGAKFGTNGNLIDVTESGNDGIMFSRNSSKTGYYLAKFLSKQETMLEIMTQKNSNHYNPILRKVEVFLNFAEASNELFGPTAKGTYVNDAGQTVTCKYSAYDVIKMVRKTSGGIEDTGYLDEMAADKDLFRKLILNERRLEFAFENQRYYDLRRWLMPLNETIKGVKVVKNENETFTYDTDVNVTEYKFDDIRYYYAPLPYSECVKNPNLINNLGWK